jgi:hypothetical protein
MVFAIIAIVISVSYVTYSLNTLDQYNQSTLARNQESINAGQESFQLFNTKIVGGKFNITVTNTGNLPINITRMWVQNTTATDWTNAYSINKMVNPGSLLTNIGQSSPVGANPLYSYNIKLTTSRGNALQFSIGSPTANPLFVQLDAIPSTVHTNQNATFLYIVQNNMTSNNALVNITPTMSCRGTGTAVATVWGPFPSTYPSLPSGGTAIFKWTAKITNSSSIVVLNVICSAGILQNGAIVVFDNASDTVWINHSDR